MRDGVNFIKNMKASSLLNVAIYLTAIGLMNQVYLFRKELKEFRGSVVYDIDRVRQNMYEEMSYMYLQGCHYGTDYPQEYRYSSAGFNVNSPVNYCHNERESKWEPYIMDRISKVGKK